MLGAALVVTFLFYLLYSTRAEGATRYWAYVMTPATMVIIYATNQRAAWVGLALCSGLLALVKTHMRRVARGLVTVGLLVFLSGLASHLSIWEGTLFSKRQQTVRERLVNNLTTLDMGMANPLFGVGYGNFKTEWPKYFHHGVYDDVIDLTDGNHNTFLGLFAEAGLVGLIPFVLILYQMFRVGLRVYGKAEGFEREFALVFLLAALSYVIGANFSDYRNAQFCNTTIFLLFGAVASIEAHMASPSNV
jgi:O-antigen ligase